MEINNVLKLIDAGFTKEEIIAVLKVDIPAKTEQTQPEPEKTEAPEPQPEKTMDMFNDSLTNFLNEINKSIDRMYKANLRTASQPEEKPDSPESILAQIIAPGKE